MIAKFRNVGLSVILGLAVLFSWFQPLDTAAISQVDDGFKRALASFAVARALNAVISVVQETQVSVQVGVGATFAPGQVLDPVNDLVEQFGDLMLAASVAFGIMHVLIKIGSFWFFSLMLTVTAFAWIWMRWGIGSAPVWLSRFIIVLLFVRFSIPVVTVGSDLAFKQFLANDYSQSQRAIQASSVELSELEKESVGKGTVDTEPSSTANTQKPASEISQQDIEEGAVNPSTNQAQEPPQKQGGVWNGLKTFTKAMVAKANVIPQAISKAKQKFENKIKKLKDSADQLVEHIVKIMVIFILQTIIIPVGLLWLMFKLMFGITRSMEKKRV